MGAGFGDDDFTGVIRLLGKMEENKK